MDWDDYRFFSALAHEGSVRGAALTLGVNASTVTRRLEALETHLGVRLFQRSQRGLILTTEGEVAVAPVDDVAERLAQLEQQLKGQNQAFSGLVRLAAPDDLAVGFVIQELATLGNEFPGIELQVLLPHASHDLSSGTLDLEIRCTSTPPETMVGIDLGRVAYAVFEAEDGQADAWVDRIGDDELAVLSRSVLTQYLPDRRVAMSCNDLFMQRAAVRAGVGAALLPVWLAQDDAQLQRVASVPVQHGPTVWLLAHPDLRRAQRVQIVIQSIRDVFADWSQRLIGAGTDNDA